MPAHKKIITLPLDGAIERAKRAAASGNPDAMRAGLELLLAALEQRDTVLIRAEVIRENRSEGWESAIPDYTTSIIGNLELASVSTLSAHVRFELGVEAEDGEVLPSGEDQTLQSSIRQTFAPDVDAFRRKTTVRLADPTVSGGSTEAAGETLSPTNPILSNIFNDTELTDLLEELDPKNLDNPDWVTWLVVEDTTPDEREAARTAILSLRDALRGNTTTP